ncbi:cytochrome c550 [Jeotgalibacillus haloalkalitolerans]|uniref:Cytochrome c n=1 Tax=Jeotgalibacillus haloalkalitolerans TaxID=3104292 RepID=A0ABU5KLR7_9BACL|nr:cytochrome c [Jeotgalibacillus sp. HH7-29]MDZ5712193.1 cytochrome c [Jeotgalibacillus sp. HH7-29]
MNKNPIIPFLLIMVLGFGVVFFMSVQGLDDSEEMAGEEEGGGEEAAGGDFDPEAHYQSTCIGCHGENYEGASGPSLVGVGENLSVDEIADIMVNGRGGMPGGQVDQENAQAMAEWVAEIGAEGGGEEGAEEGSSEEEGSEEGGDAEEGSEESSEEDAA